MDSLKLYYQNVRGIRSKTREVKLNILSNDYDIIIFTESWLNGSVFNGEFIDARYTVYRRDREKVNKAGGGGVLIAVKNSIRSRRMSQWDGMDCEDLWITVDVVIQGKLDHVAIGVVYLPPPLKKDALKILLSNISANITKNRHVLLVGDFNMNSLSWSQSSEHNCLIATSSNNIDSLFVDFMEEQDLRQFNSVTNANGRLLDLVLSKCIDLSVNNNTYPISIVDAHHPPLNIKLLANKISDLEERRSEKYNFFKADYNVINTELENTAWIDFFQNCTNVNEMQKCSMRS